MKGQPSNDEEKLLDEIKQLRQDLEELRQAPFRIPVLGADPDAASSCNLWMLEDGRIRTRTKAGTVKEYAPVTTAGGSGSTVAPPIVVVPTSRIWEEDAAWAQAYRGNLAQRTDGPSLYYGNGDTYNQQNRSMIGWNMSSLRPALGGGTVQRAWLRISNLHAWLNSGVDLSIGLHGQDSKPATFSETANAQTRQHYGKPEHEAWREIPASMVERMRDSAASGFTLNQSSDARASYGYAAGVGDSKGAPPRLKIEYTK